MTREEKEEALKWFKDRKKMNLDDKCQQAENMAIEALEQKSKTGHWVSVNTGKQIMLKDGMTTESVKCSECDEWLTASGEYSLEEGDYCPNCGARMVEPKESEDK